MESLYEHSIPTFASCWGFQALARALGGRVVTDHARAEVGVLPLDLTEAGRNGIRYSARLGPGFPVVIGHEDIVDELPPRRGEPRLERHDRERSPDVFGKAHLRDPVPSGTVQGGPHRSGSPPIPPYLQLTGASSLEELRAITPETPGADQPRPPVRGRGAGGQGTPVFRPAPPRVAGRDRVLPTETKRGDGLERRPPVGTARRRRANGAVRLSPMGQIRPRITARIRKLQGRGIRDWNRVRNSSWHGAV